MYMHANNITEPYYIDQNVIHKSSVIQIFTLELCEPKL